MRFIAGKFADALSEDAEMMNNVRYVLDVMVTEDFSNLGRVVGISTWEFMAKFISPEIDAFMKDPDAYQANAKAFKAPKAKKAKKAKKASAPKPGKGQPRSKEGKKKESKKKQMKCIKQRLKGLVTDRALSPHVGTSATIFASEVSVSAGEGSSRSVSVLAGEGSSQSVSVPAGEGSSLFLAEPPVPDSPSRGQ